MEMDLRLVFPRSAKLGYTVYDSYAYSLNLSKAGDLDFLRDFYIES